MESSKTNITRTYNRKGGTFREKVRTLQPGQHIEISADYLARQSAYCNAKQGFPGWRFSIETVDRKTAKLIRVA